MTRSKKKGAYIAYHLLKKLVNFKESDKKKLIKTWSRASTILPKMIGYTIGVYNGKVHYPIYISDSLIGHKLGEFVSTRSFRSHKKVEQKSKR